MEMVLIKTLLSLAAVLGLIGLLVILLRKVIVQRRWLGTQQVAIDVVGQRLLQPRRMLLVVRVQKRLFLLASTESGLQLLQELGQATDHIGRPAVVALADEHTQVGEEKEFPSSFAEYLKHHFFSTPAAQSRNASHAQTRDGVDIPVYRHTNGKS